MAPAGSGSKEKEMQTHIYIMAEEYPIRKSDRLYGYLICAEGREYRKMEIKLIESSYERAVLKALTEALDRFSPRVGCSIEIHCESGQIRRHVVDGTLRNTWQFNGWKNRKGQEIKNRDLWQMLYNQIYETGRGWNITWAPERRHRYSDYMRQQANRETDIREMP